VTENLRLQVRIGPNLAQNQVLTSSTDLLDMKFAMSATACLIAGLDLMSKEENFGAFGIIRYDNLSYMRLDNAAVQALNLLPTQRDRKFLSLNIHLSSVLFTN